MPEITTSDYWRGALQGLRPAIDMMETIQCL